MEDLGWGSPSGCQTEGVSRNRRIPMCHLGTDRTDGDQISHQGWKKGEWGNGHLGQTSLDWKQVMQMAK